MAKKKTDTPRSFAHDSNARNSSKLLKLRMAHGAEAYGVYFMLLERLRDASGYTEELNYDVLAYDLRVAPGLIRSVIEDFGLFAITPDGASFYSETLTSRLSAQYVTAAPSEQPDRSDNSDSSDNSDNSDNSDKSDSSDNSDNLEQPLERPSEPEAPSLREMIDEASCDDDWLFDIGEDLFLDNEYLTNVIRSDFYDYCCKNNLQFDSVNDLKLRFCNWLLPQV